MNTKRSYPLKLSDIKIIGKKVAATRQQVAELEDRWWVKFPAGYADFVTEVGEGLLGGFVRVYGPWLVELEREDWRRRVMRHWFWGDESPVLPKNRGVECVVIGDTVNGDEIVFHPTQPGRLFVLPRDLEETIEIQGGLLEAIDRICRSGELVEPIEKMEFEPFDSRTELAKQKAGSPKDPPGESLDEMIEMAKAWVKRHKLKAKAKAVLADNNKRGADVEVLYEGLIFGGDFVRTPGYGVGWRLLEGADKKQVGVILWSSDGETSQAHVDRRTKN